VPHLDVYTLETDLAGRESALIEALTTAVVAVYGEWVRPSVVVRLIGLPAGRWAVGGRPAAVAAPSVTFGIRADALDRPDAATVLGGLATRITEAIAVVLGEQQRDGTTVEFVAQRAGRIAVGGTLGA
jgi:phenylpyruvate tautomerase PptA (4-oxalocrotonate tautomerase family)